LEYQIVTGARKTNLGFFTSLSKVTGENCDPATAGMPGLIEK
jgi:hypothetical protein